MAQPKVSSRRRINAIVVLLTVVMVLTLIFRVGYIMIIDADNLKEKAADQWTRERPVAPKRGTILDANGKTLAQSASCEMVVIYPKQISEADKKKPGTLDSVVSTLTAELGLNADTVRKKAQDTTKSAIILKRQVTKEQASRLREIGLAGVAFSEDMKRYYSTPNFLTQVLGFTSVDGEGLEGIESRYNKYLAGTAGMIVSETDRDGNEIPDSVEQYIPPVDGNNVRLTIDSVIQSSCERAMDLCLKEQNAKRVTCIVMDPMTGAILAIVNKPDFDNNAPPRDDIKQLQALMRNTAVADAMEPGSTFKILTLASGLDAGVINKDSTFDCNGYRIVEGQKIKCWSARTHGHETLYQGVQNSCNPVFMDIALKLGRDRFYEYLYAFGLGKPLGIDLNGEATGIVTSPKYVRDIDLARIGFGQSIAVTPLQLIAASAAAINGGSLMKPYIVQEVTTPEGEVVIEFKPEKVNQVIKPETSALVRDILKAVVEKGSGKNARIAGYEVGGKTGTAQKYGEDGRIMQNRHIGSFIAFAPVSKPKYIVLVVVDEPNVAVDYGSIVAAPYAKMILEDSLKYGDVPPTAAGDTAQPSEQVEVPDVVGMELEQAASELQNKGFKYVVEGYGGAVADLMPKPGFMAEKGSTVMVYMKLEDDGNSDNERSMPDLVNKTAVEVNNILSSLGLELKAEGNGGVAVRQDPAPGTTVYSGEIVEVEFVYPAPTPTPPAG